MAQSSTYQELVKMSREDLLALLKKTRLHLFKLKLEARTNQLKEVTKVGIAKKEVAQILTALREIAKNTPQPSSQKSTK